MPLRVLWPIVVVWRSTGVTGTGSTAAGTLTSGVVGSVSAGVMVSVSGVVVLGGVSLLAVAVVLVVVQGGVVAVGLAKTGVEVGISVAVAGEVVVGFMTVYGCGLLWLSGVEKSGVVLLVTRLDDEDGVGDVCTQMKIEELKVERRRTRVGAVEDACLFVQGAPSRNLKTSYGQ